MFRTRFNFHLIACAAAVLALAQGLPAAAGAADGADGADGAGGDPKAGRQKSQHCVSCHGRNGIAVLARRTGFEGSIGEYVTELLTAYRDGRRQQIQMTALAVHLSDADIADIAAYFQSLAVKSAE